VVRAVDDAGNLAINFSETVQLSLDPSGPSASLSGATTQTFNHGVATFSDLKVSKAGTGYKLLAQSMLTHISGVSNLFDVFGLFYIPIVFK
jgi:hypothetical protein